MMTRTNKFWLSLYGGLAMLVVGEQTGLTSCCWSMLSSTTSTSEKRAAPMGDLVSMVRTEKPLLRWLPLIKYGETVYVVVDQHPVVTTALFQREAITRTRLLTIGLCSTAKYDEMARAPFEQVRREFKKR